MLLESRFSKAHSTRFSGLTEGQKCHVGIRLLAESLYHPRRIGVRSYALMVESLGPRAEHFVTLLEFAALSGTSVPTRTVLVQSVRWALIHHGMSQFIPLS